MSKNKHYPRPTFFRSHADTLAIIAVNVAFIALLLSMIISNSHRIDACNARTDQMHSEFLDILKEIRK